MKFITQAKASIYGPDFYDDVVVAKPFRSSIWYFYSLTLILSFITTVLFAMNVVPAINNFLNDTTASFLKHYPDELVLTFKGGHVSTNVTDREPYLIPLPEGFKNSLPADEIDVVNMLVIDTTRPFDINEFHNYKTFAMLTADEVVTLDNHGAVKIQSLRDMPDQQIDKKKVSTFIDAIQPFFKFAGPVVVVFMFLAFLVGSSLYLVYLLLLACAVWVIAKAKKRPLSYKKSYQVGIHALTLSLILTTIRLNFFAGVSTSLLFLIIFVVEVWINLAPRKEVVAEPVVVPDVTPVA